MSYFDLIPEELNQTILFYIDDGQYMHVMMQFDAFKSIKLNKYFWLEKYNHDFPRIQTYYLKKLYNYYWDEEKLLLALIKYEKFSLLYKRVSDYVDVSKKNGWPETFRGSSISLELLELKDEVLEEILFDDDHKIYIELNDVNDEKDHIMIYMRSNTRIVSKLIDNNEFCFRILFDIFIKDNTIGSR